MSGFQKADVALSVVAAAGDLIVGTAAGAVTNLGVGAAGTVLGGGSTPGYVYPAGYEINYTAATSPISVTDSAEATATALLSPGAITFDGAAVIVEFFCADVQVPGGVNDLVIGSLFEGSTQITRFFYITNEVAAVTENMPVCAKYRFTPSAGSHTYKFTAYSSGGAGVLGAGNGGTGGLPPTFIRFTKV